MESVEQQWQQLKERYAQMTEDELAALAQSASDLAEVAQEALQAVIAERGLDTQLKMEPPAQLRGHPPGDEERVILGWAESAEEAGRTMKTLAAAGIPSFLSLEVRADDVKRAHAALEQALEDEDTEENEEFAVLCPKCRSGAVVMEERDSASTAPFHWHCDTCGHHWSDEAIEQEVQPGQEDDEAEDKNYSVLCPKCRSGAVVLEKRVPSPTAPFHWRCDACGHQWSDSGIEQEVPAGQQEEEDSGNEHS